MKLLLNTILMVALFYCASSAVGPGQGEITVFPGNLVSKLTVKYNLDSFFGEPTVNGCYMWESSVLTSLSSDVVVWLTLMDTNENTAFLVINSTVPKVGEWGFNVTGSPNWDKALVTGYNGNAATGYLTASQAKTFWKSNFKVVDANLSVIMITSVNENQIRDKALRLNIIQSSEGVIILAPFSLRNVKVSLFDMSGRMMKSITANNDMSIKIDLSRVKKGVFAVNIKSDGVNVKKILYLSYDQLFIRYQN